jgi:hypothetical protein
MIPSRASGVHVPLHGAGPSERTLPGVPALFGLLRFLLGVSFCGEGDDEIGEEEGVADAERFIGTLVSGLIDLLQWAVLILTRNSPSGFGFPN